MNFTIGKHAEQIHEYTNALIDEAYSRKDSDNPTSAQERSQNADLLCESYFEQVGSYPSENVLSRLAWYIVFDEMTDKNEHKVSSTEYPILSEHQEKYRQKREKAISDVFTGENDETIGRSVDHGGIKRRIYDYMTPDRDKALLPAKYLDLYNALENAGLTDRQRQAIELVYFEGMTQEDAAEIMGVSHKGVVGKYCEEGIDELREYMLSNG